MEKEQPTRKKNRLSNYDYSNCGAYFLTICTAKRVNCFWCEIPPTVGASSARPLCPQNVELSAYGKIADDAIKNIKESYPALTVDHYVIMPDHIHLLLSIRADENGRALLAPTVSHVVQQLKGYVTKRIGHSIWQKSFFDHVIRNKADYEKHIKYIYENPLALYYD